jgi:hypothetical protein
MIMPHVLTSSSASVTCESTLVTREPSCVPKTAKSFFIPMVHSPLGAWDTWQHRSSPLEKVEPEAMGYVAALEPTSTGRRGPEQRDTWQRWSSPQQGGEVWGRGTRGSIGAHLSREARSGAVGHMVAPEPTLSGRRCLRPRDTWQRQNPPR